MEIAWAILFNCGLRGSSITFKYNDRNKQWEWEAKYTRNKAYSTLVDSRICLIAWLGSII